MSAGVVAGVFEAQYPGTCNDCGDRFETGELIRFGAAREVEHAECPDDIATQGRDVCPRCFTEKALSGACSCD